MTQNLHFLLSSLDPLVRSGLPERKRIELLFKSVKPTLSTDDMSTFNTLQLLSQNYVDNQDRLLESKQANFRRYLDDDDREYKRRAIQSMKDDAKTELINYMDELTSTRK